jgi:hypothetical protein
MKMNNIYIKTDYHNIFERVFTNKDLISIKDLVDMLEEQYYEIKYLEEKIEDLEQPKEFDEHTAWQDQQLEEGVI